MPHVSLFRPRILATSCLLAQVLLLAVPTAVRAAPATPAADTWQQLATPPSIGTAPIFALAVDPASAQTLLVGTASGDIYRSQDGGGAWERVASHLGQGVLSLAFVSGTGHAALAGTRGGGIWRSADEGATWQQDAGTAGRTVRSLDATTTPLAAGTETGVLTSTDGISWHPAGLAGVDVAALAVLPGTTAGLVAGGDSEPINTALPLYTEHGSTAWHRVSALLQGSSTVDALSPVSASRGAEVMMGTDAGAFSSRDGGASWAPISGYGSLPATDISAIAPVEGTSGLYYVASDGGGSSQGGLWVTRNDGAHFRSLDPPQHAVTALAVAAGAQPVIYAAGFVATDHAVRLWSFTDAGGAPHVAAPKTAPKGGHRSLAASAGSRGADWLTALATGPEAPFVAAFALAALLLIAASVAYVRGARRL